MSGILNQQEFAYMCEVSRETIRLWEAEGMPGISKPTRNAVEIDVQLAIPWVRAKKWTLDMNDRARQAKAEADMAEMDRDEQARTLVNAVEMQAAEADFLSRLRTNLMGFPDRLIPMLEEATDERERLAIGKREMATTLRDIVARETGLDAP